MATPKKYILCSLCKGEKTGSHVSYCKPCFNKYKRARYVKFRDAEVARCMAYNYANYDAFKTRLSEYRKTPKWKDTVATYRADNKDKVREWDRTKRGKRLSVDGNHTNQDIQDILNIQKWKCAEPTCKKCLKVSAGYHVDHIMPIALGGTDYPKNLQCLCPSCNTHKWATHPIDWARKKGRLL